MSDYEIKYYTDFDLSVTNNISVIYKKDWWNKPTYKKGD